MALGTPPAKRSAWRTLGLGIQLGLTMIISVGLGLWLGVFLQQKLAAPSWVIILCLLIGIVGGMKAVYEQIKWII